MYMYTHIFICVYTLHVCVHLRICHMSIYIINVCTYIQMLSVLQGGLSRGQQRVAHISLKRNHSCVSIYLYLYKSMCVLYMDISLYAYIHVMYYNMYRYTCAYTYVYIHVYMYVCIGMSRHYVCLWICTVNITLSIYLSIHLSIYLCIYNV